MIRGLLQGAWNVGHRKRQRELEARVARLERWVLIHAPFIPTDAVPWTPYVSYDPLSDGELDFTEERLRTLRKK